MKKEELCGLLRGAYTSQKGYGVTKVDDPRYKNISFVVPPAPPRQVPPKLPIKAMSQANQVLNSLPSFDEMSDLDKLVNYLFVRREALQSSRLEGTWSTLDHVLTPAAVYDSGRGPSEYKSIRGYAHTLEKHFEKAWKFKEKIFSSSLVSKIHKDILTKDPHFTGSAGVLRSSGQPGGIVFIGGLHRREDSIYNPPPPKFVKSSLAKVLEWLSDKELAERGDAGVGFSLPLRIAIGHCHFEGVHPFSNGNGRVGRALWPLQMICAGHSPLFLSGYVEKEHEEYSKALQSAQKQLVYGPIIEFICEAIVQSSREASITKEAVLSFPKKWKIRSKFRAHSASERALEVLIRNPIITTRVLMTELKISKQAANVALGQLVERHIIRERAKSGRVHVYAAEELIQLLSREFGVDADLAIEAGFRALKSP